MTVVRRTYVDGLHGQVHVRHVQPGGRAAPLVCLHPTPLSGRCYEPFMAQFDDRAVYALDTPGYGGSDHPPHALTIAQYAESLSVAIEALGIDGPFDLLGMHTGTRLAVEIALAGRLPVRRMVFVGCALYTPAERAASEQWSYDLEIPKPETSGSAQIMRLWDNFVEYRRDGVDDAMLKRWLSDVLHDHERSSWAHVGVYAHDLSTRLPLVEQPVLIINADDDLHIPTRRAPALLRRSKLVDLSPAGFGVLEAYPERCAALVRAYLDEAD